VVDPSLHRRTTIVLMAYYSNFFVIGVCLYLIHAGRARPVTWVVLGLAIAMSARGGGEQAFYASGLLYFCVTAAFALLVWLATTTLGRRAAIRPLVFLGRISYPLYLLHVVVGFQVIRIGVERGWSTAEGVAAAALVSLLAATLLHYLIEEPGERWWRTALNPRISFATYASGLLLRRSRGGIRPEVPPTEREARPGTKAIWTRCEGSSECVPCSIKADAGGNVPAAKEVSRS
jgi:peptidoglycan/LPS O-acetylase OafA/YrhL